MKVSTAIKLLEQYYEPTDEIAISWWDEEWAIDLLSDKEFTPEQAKELFSNNVEAIEEIVSDQGGEYVSSYLFRELEYEKGKHNEQ